MAATGTHSGKATRPAKSINDLRDPAHLCAKGTMQVDFTDYGNVGALDSYMRLPVEQYSVLDPKLITMLGNNRFLLKVPKIEVMNVWIEPLATVAVLQEENPPRVHLTTEKCEVYGSDMLQALNLDGKYSMNFDAVLTWESALRNGMQQSGNAKGKITGDARFDVWCEVQPPFHLMPKPVLEAACNVPMDALMKLLLPVFMSTLKSDYQKWATSEDYRAQRAKASWVTLQSQPL